MTNNDYPDLITRWGEPNKIHEAIIIGPPSSTNDLILTSRVIGKKYIYIAENRSICDMHVRWDGPGVPGINDSLLAGFVGSIPKEVHIETIWSPKKIRTSASVIPMQCKYQLRNVIAEEAHAYIPSLDYYRWNSLLTVEGIKDLLKTGLSLTSELIVGGMKLFKIISKVISGSDVYLYSLSVENGKDSYITGMISTDRAYYNFKQIRFQIEPEGAWSPKSFESTEFPGEFWAPLQVCAFLEQPDPIKSASILPVALLIPYTDAGRCSR